MDAKIALVTGANSGIGFETAKALVQRGMHVVLVCRDQARGKNALSAIRRLAAGREPALLLADLSSQGEIRRLNEEIRARYRRLDVLVNNAGACFERRELTVDGIEKTFATNHLAPFLLTNLVLDLVEAAPGGRIVNVVSEAYPGRLDLTNLQGERSYNFFGAYAQSKLENILFTFELARRLDESGTTVNCVSPGPSVTRFGDNMRGAAALFPKVMKRLPFFKSPEYGARGVVRLASAPELAGVSGRLFLRERELKAKPVATDPELARRLWNLSAEMTGLLRVAA